MGAKVMELGEVAERYFNNKKAVLKQHKAAENIYGELTRYRIEPV